MTKKKHPVRNSDWTIVEKDTGGKGKKRQSARRTERNQSYTEKEELIDDLIEERWKQYRANRHVNATIDYRYDYHKYVLSRNCVGFSRIFSRNASFD